MKQFVVSCTSDKIWNYLELIKFLVCNQNKEITLKLVPEAVCLANLGLYDILNCFEFTRVTIITQNPIENHDRYTIIKKKFFNWFEQIPVIDTNLHTWNKNKIFYCLFGRPTASRLGLCSHLYKNYKNKSHLHFSATTDQDELIQIELDKLLKYNVSCIEPVGTLINQLPLLLSSSELYTATNGYNFSDPLTNFYKDIFVDILSESHVSGTTFYPTEKTVRAMWVKKPFIIFASKNYLDYLHQMGFRSFGDFWSEDYDGYDGKDRFIRMLTLIDNLANTPISKLEQMYWDMQYTLDHNYNLLKNQNYNVNITYIS